MAFNETPRYPEELAAGTTFGPSYSTSKASNQGGYEFSNQNWEMPLHEGDLMSGVKDQDDLDILLAYYHGVNGMHDGFRFKNFNDFEVTGSQGTVVQLTGTTWQMYKTYTYGALTKARKITKPLAGATILGGGSYSYSTSTGIITALGSPTVVPTGWTGTFDFPVRFNLDKMLPEWINFELYEFSIPIVELRI